MMTDTEQNVLRIMTDHFKEKAVKAKESGYLSDWVYNTMLSGWLEELTELREEEEEYARNMGY